MIFGCLAAPDGRSSRPQDRQQHLEIVAGRLLVGIDQALQLDRSGTSLPHPATFDDLQNFPSDILERQLFHELRLGLRHGPARLLDGMVFISSPPDPAIEACFPAVSFPLDQHGIIFQSLLHIGPANT